VTFQPAAHTVDSFKAFTACSVLLYEASQTLLYNLSDGVEEDLSRVKSCIDMLNVPTKADRVAEKCLAVTQPLCESLLALHSETSAILPSRNLGASAMRAEAMPTAQSAADILRSPFGHEGRMKIGTFSRSRTESPDWWI